MQNFVSKNKNKEWTLPDIRAHKRPANQPSKIKGRNEQVSWDRMKKAKTMVKEN